MTEAAFGVYLITLALVCLSVYACFRGIAWVVQNGWRSMLGLVAVRGEAVIEWQDCDRKPCGCPTGGIDYSCKPCRERLFGEHVDTALDILLTHEATPDVDQFGEPEEWEALEEEFADLDDLAAKLGERAS